MLTPEEFNQLKALLSEQLAPVLEKIANQSFQIELLKQQLKQQQAETHDLLSHIDNFLQGKEEPPMPISEAWKLLGFRTAGALRGAIRRGVYTQERGEVLRRGTSILVNVQKCMESGYTPIHRRRRDHST